MCKRSNLKSVVSASLVAMLVLCVSSTVYAGNGATTFLALVDGFGEDPDDLCVVQLAIDPDTGEPKLAIDPDTGEPFVDANGKPTGELETVGPPRPTTNGKGLLKSGHIAVGQLVTVRESSGGGKKHEHRGHVTVLK